MQDPGIHKEPNKNTKTFWNDKKQVEATKPYRFNYGHTKDHKGIAETLENIEDKKQKLTIELKN